MGCASSAIERIQGILMATVVLTRNTAMNAAKIEVTSSGSEVHTWRRPPLN
jgi:hypothetical protein